MQLDELEMPTQNAGTYGLGIDNTFTTCGRAYGHDGNFLASRDEVIATANGKRQAVVMVNVDDSRVSWMQIHTFVQKALCRG